MKHLLKRILHGYIPYYICRVFSPTSPCLKYYKYIKNNGYARHLFEFRGEYESLPITVEYDEERNLHYVSNKQGRKLYFRRGTPPHRIAKHYRILAMEQDARSPHRYFDNPAEAEGTSFVDVGSAEGYTSLEIVDRVRHLYLFEADRQWLEALEATFTPWKEKVTINPRRVGERNTAGEVTLDAFFGGKDESSLFLKMDIEGAERQALWGAKKLFSTQKLKFAICTYHKDDCDVIPRLLETYPCTFIKQYGFFRNRLRCVVVRGQTNQCIDSPIADNH